MRGAELMVVEPDRWVEVAADVVSHVLRSAGAAPSLALSGGSTPWSVYAELARRGVPEPGSTVVQVDERILPDGHDDRNDTGIRASFGGEPGHYRPFPVDPLDLDAARAIVAELGGVIDVAVLGLGDDGHTASLVPGDPVLLVEHDDVATTADYRGTRRITLTYPALARARRRVVLVRGAAKATALAAALGGGDVPAALVPGTGTVIIADPDAAGSMA